MNLTFSRALSLRFAVKRVRQIVRRRFDSNAVVVITQKPIRQCFTYLTCRPALG